MRSLQFDDWPNFFTKVKTSRFQSLQKTSSDALKKERKWFEKHYTKVYNVNGIVVGYLRTYNMLIFVINVRHIKYVAIYKLTEP